MNWRGPVVCLLVAGQLGPLHQELDTVQVASPGGMMHQASPQLISDAWAQGTRLKQPLQGGYIPILGGRQCLLLFHPKSDSQWRLVSLCAGPAGLPVSGVDAAEGSGYLISGSLGRWEAATGGQALGAGPQSLAQRLELLSMERELGSGGRDM